MTVSPLWTLKRRSAHRMILTVHRSRELLSGALGMGPAPARTWNSRSTVGMLVSLARLVSTSSCREAEGERPVLSHPVIPDALHTPANTPQAAPSILRLTGN